MASVSRIGRNPNSIYNEGVKLRKAHVQEFQSSVTTKAVGYTFRMLNNLQTLQLKAWAGDKKAKKLFREAGGIDALNKLKAKFKEMLPIPTKNFRLGS